MNPTTSDTIVQWLAAHGLEVVGVEALLGDVSTRSYFRLTLASGTTWVVARYPAELASTQQRFRRAGELLDAAGVRTPRLELEDAALGLALLEDLGPHTLYELARSWSDLPGELEAAIAALRAIAALPPLEVAALGSPPLDRALLERELGQTLELFLAPSGLATAGLVSALGDLCGRLASDPPVACHRDLMARNLMPDGSGGVVILDFQDLRLGPPAYDLASLLNDSLFADPALEALWVERLLPTRHEREQYRRAVVQRALKAVGTFVKFAAQGKRRHLVLIEPTLGRATRFLAELPETRQLFLPLRSGFAAAARGAVVC